MEAELKTWRDGSNGHCGAGLASDPQLWVSSGFPFIAPNTCAEPGPRPHHVQPREARMLPAGQFIQSFLRECLGKILEAGIEKTGSKVG